MEEERQVAEEVAYDPSQLPEFLQQYYVWLFPFDKYYEWLSYGEGEWDTHSWVSEISRMQS